MNDTIKIVFRTPPKTAPGFLRRQRRALELNQRLNNAPTPEIIDELVEFLLDYIEQPAERKQAREALWDATEEQFMAMLTALQGGSADTVPPPSAVPS